MTWGLLKLKSTDVSQVIPAIKNRCVYRVSVGGAAE